MIRNLDTAPGSPYHRGERVAALTFDDGPSPVYTPQILRILAAAWVPASFEIIGTLGAAYPGIVRAENAAGMALVNHTWTHPDLALLPAWRWPAEVDRTSRLLRGITGHPVRCLRLPYGLADSVVDARLRARGLAELGWDIDPSDYLRPRPAVIARRVVAALHPGTIVVMHDGGGNRSRTVAALPAIIRGIRAAGYQIVPVCAGLVVRRWGEILASRQGLTRAQWQTLWIAAASPLTAPQIARRLGVSRQNVQRVANDLAAAGMATFGQNPDHKSSPLLDLTPPRTLAAEDARHQQDRQPPAGPAGQATSPPGAIGVRKDRHALLLPRPAFHLTFSPERV